MADSYKSGKWSGTLKADLAGDAKKTTPTLDNDFDTALSNLKKVQKHIFENKYGMERWMLLLVSYLKRLMTHKKKSGTV